MGILAHLPISILEPFADPVSSEGRGQFPLRKYLAKIPKDFTVGLSPPFPKGTDVLFTGVNEHWGKRKKEKQATLSVVYQIMALNVID